MADPFTACIVAEILTSFFAVTLRFPFTPRLLPVPLLAIVTLPFGAFNVNVASGELDKNNGLLNAA